MRAGRQMITDDSGFRLEGGPFGDMLFNVIGVLSVVVIYLFLIAQGGVIGAGPEQPSESPQALLEIRNDRVYWMTDGTHKINFRDFEAYQAGGIALQLRDTALGETLDEASNPASEFHALIQEIAEENRRAGSATKRHVCFIVRPGGFPHYDAFRRLAEKEGVAVAWFPFTDGSSVLLGASGGVKPGVQPSPGRQ